MKDESMTIARIRADLSRLIAAAPTLTHAKGAGRVFELYLMMRLARKLKDAGWIVEPLDHKGNPIAGGTFIQRGGKPTGVLPATASSGPSSIRIQHYSNGHVYEVLNGVQFKGRSNALHELDIAVVPAGISATLRTGISDGYPVVRPPIAIECKDVGENGSPDEMRTVIARMYDLTILDGHRRYAFVGTLPPGSIFAGGPLGPWTSHGTSAMTFLQENQRALCILARRTNITAGAYPMAGLFHVKTYPIVDRATPSAKALVDETVTWMGVNL